MVNDYRDVLQVRSTVFMEYICTVWYNLAIGEHQIKKLFSKIGIAKINKRYRLIRLSTQLYTIRRISRNVQLFIKILYEVRSVTRFGTLFKICDSMIFSIVFSFLVAMYSGSQDILHSYRKTQAPNVQFNRTQPKTTKYPTEGTVSSRMHGGYCYLTIVLFVEGLGNMFCVH